MHTLAREQRYQQRENFYQAVNRPDYVAWSPRLNAALAALRATPGFDFEAYFRALPYDVCHGGPEALALAYEAKVRELNQTPTA